MNRRVFLPVAAFLLAACSDQPSPTAPPQTAAAPPPSLAVDGATLAVGTAPLDFSTDVGDLQRRVLPGFPDAAAATRLSGYLDELNAKIIAGDAEEATRLLALARSVAKPGATNWGDLGVINLVLDNIGRALGEQ